MNESILEKIFPMSEEEKAKLWVKTNSKKIIATFCPLAEFPGTVSPYIMFMAGSPGAGKTESSKTLIEQLSERVPPICTAHIDTDSVRDMIPGYNGDNAAIYQGAAAIGVQKLLDHIFNKKQNAIIDTTLSDERLAKENIERALKKGRDYSVGITYIYRDPIIAWRFTKIRQVMEKRSVGVDVFLDAFFSIPDILKSLKKEYGEAITIDLVIKGCDNDGRDKLLYSPQNVSLVDIDKYIKLSYNRSSLREKLLEIEKFILKK